MPQQNVETPAHILIIEDEPAIADTVVYALETEGFSTQWCANGETGLEEFHTNKPDVIILDVGLPDINGFDLCRRIRQESDVPIIFLTARTDEIDRVVGLELGADDYVLKPFSPRELSARVRARLRRKSTPSKQSKSFSIDEASYRILYQGTDLDLSRYEYRLLHLLLQQPKRIYSREQLMQQVWDEPERSFDRTVDTHIKTLRSKIRQQNTDKDFIKTHRGLGYSYQP